MDPLLHQLKKDCTTSKEDLASLLDTTVEDITARITAYESNGAILGYQAVIDSERAGNNSVTAVIEVKISPEREGGFDRLATRIAKFDQVLSCYLMSGGYDLMVIVEGESLNEVASFVSQRLSTIGGVLSTATHFRLKAYKENGALITHETDPERLPVTP